MMRQIISLSLILFVFAFVSNAQLREVPAVVKDAFSEQYPEAENVKYIDNLLSIQVQFTQNGTKFKASYTNKGRWKETEKDWSFNQLSTGVKDGFGKSKYADWQVAETKIVYRPGNNERYRVKVGKNDLQKKFLFFNEDGRLLEEQITI